MKPVGLSVSLPERALALVQVGALSFAPVLTFWAVNFGESPRVSTLLLIPLITFVLATIGALIATRWSRDTFFKFIAGESGLLLAFFNWEALGLFRARPVDMHANEHALAALLSSAIVVLMYRVGAAPWVRLAVFSMSLVVLVAGVVRITALEVAPGPTTLHSARMVVSPSVGREPDIYFIVLDGYGRADVLREDFALEQTTFTHELQRHGFVSPGMATANYSLTLASIPSILSMEFPIEGGVKLDLLTERALNDIARGSNPVTRFLKGRGYSYVHVEGGLSATRCGDLADRCIPWSLLDDFVMGFVETTPLGALVRTTVHTRFADRTLGRFKELAKLALSQTREPRFVFAHLLIPHPPLFIRADCSIDVDPRRGGTTVGIPDNASIIDFRRAAYADQIRCLNRRLIELIEVIPSESVVILTGDHGPDSRSQLWKDVRTWTAPDVFERMSVFSAYRLPTQCKERIPDDMSLVNTFRVIFGCVFDAPLGLLPNRMFLVGIDRSTLEVTPGT